MSAFSHTDWTVICDWDKCPKQLRTDDLELSWDNNTARAVRQVLKRRGWAISVPGGSPGKRLDFCPVHKEEGIRNARTENPHSRWERGNPGR